MFDKKLMMKIGMGLLFGAFAIHFGIKTIEEPNSVGDKAMLFAFTLGLGLIVFQNYFKPPRF